MRHSSAKEDTDNASLMELATGALGAIIEFKETPRKYRRTSNGREAAAEPSYEQNSECTAANAIDISCISGVQVVLASDSGTTSQRQNAIDQKPPRTLGTPNVTRLTSVQGADDSISQFVDADLELGIQTVRNDDTTVPPVRLPPGSRQSTLYRVSASASGRTEVEATAHNPVQPPGIESDNDLDMAPKATQDSKRVLEHEAIEDSGRLPSARHRVQGKREVVEDSGRVARRPRHSILPPTSSGRRVRSEVIEDSGTVPFRGRQGAVPGSGTRTVRKEVTENSLRVPLRTRQSPTAASGTRKEVILDSGRAPVRTQGSTAALARSRTAKMRTEVIEDEGWAPRPGNAAGSASGRREVIEDSGSAHCRSLPPQNVTDSATVQGSSTARRRREVVEDTGWAPRRSFPTQARAPRAAAAVSTGRIKREVFEDSGCSPRCTGTGATTGASTRCEVVEASGWAPGAHGRPQLVQPAPNRQTHDTVRDLPRRQEVIEASGWASGARRRVEVIEDCGSVPRASRQ